MNILLLDASSEVISFGYSVNGELISQNELNSENNADLLTYEVKTWLKKSGKSFEDIDIISLSNGPGSFTGLRISSAIAKGICYSLEKKLIEVNSLDILANCAEQDDQNSKVIPLISSNMRTGEFYYAEYDNRINNRFHNGVVHGHAGLQGGEKSKKRIPGLEEREVKRVSDYRMETISSIDKTALLISRIQLTEGLNLKTVSKKQEMNAQNFLTLKKVHNEEFANIISSEPLYIKEFVPLKS